MTDHGPAPIVDLHKEAVALAQTAESDAAIRGKGIVLTPHALALRLAKATLWPQSNRTLRIIDPTCGSGRLLAAAAQVANERGLSVSLHGIELEEPLAKVAAEALPQATIQTGNALDLLQATDQYDIVLLNPPYRGRLRRADAQTTHRTDALKARFGKRLGPYADPSTGFLLLAETLLAPGGRLGAIVPISIVSARDAAEARAYIATRCRTLETWSETASFAAQIHTASIVLERLATPCGSCVCDWSTLLATANGAPLIATHPNGTIGDIATVTADFRDAFYALKGHLVERDDAPAAVPVLTCGLVDPGQHLHGRRPARIHGQQWNAPCVQRHSDIEKLLHDRLVPKVLVATQTGVIEAAPDARGECMPSTPLVRVVPHNPKDVWRLAASLCAPQSTAIATHRHFGAGRAPNTLRLRASDIAALSLLDDTPATERAVLALQQFQSGSATLTQVLQTAAEAFGPVPDGLLEWWWTRAPRGLPRD